jgi:hypothetical protein
MWECHEAWRDLASGKVEVEHIFSFGSDEWNLFQLTSDPRASLGPKPYIYCVEGLPATSVGGWNRAAAEAHGDILVQVSDDMVPQQDWDLALVELLDPSKPQVLGCSPLNPAGDQGGLLTLGIMTRKYMEQKGYFIYPEYHGVFEDDDLTQAAALDDVLIDAYDQVRFDHQWGGHEGDDTYRRQNSAHGWFVGRAVYDARQFAGFPSISTGNPAGCEDDVSDPLMAPAGTDEWVLRMLFTIRMFRDCAGIRNKPFPAGDCRRDFIAGRWQRCLDGLMPLLEKYAAYAGGTFEFKAGRWMQTYCQERIK